jgi:hypothetical protein
MTYRAYNTLVLVVVRLLCVSLIAVALRAPGLAQAEVWAIVGSASAVLIGSLFLVGLVVSPTSDLTCPDSGKKVVVRVKLGAGSGHLYLTSKEES